MEFKVLVGMRKGAGIHLVEAANHASAGWAFINCPPLGLPENIGTKNILATADPSGPLIPWQGRLPLVDRRRPETRRWKALASWRSAEGEDHEHEFELNGKTEDEAELLIQYLWPYQPDLAGLRFALDTRRSVVRALSHNS